MIEIKLLSLWFIGALLGFYLFHLFYDDEKRAEYYAVPAFIVFWPMALIFVAVRITLFTPFCAVRRLGDWGRRWSQ